MKPIAVIDYDAGNTMSVINALKALGYQVELTNDVKKLYNADHIVFPGVGAYVDSMNKLREYRLIEPIKELTAKGIPFLGICLGMQLLFENSHETIGSEADREIEGLGLLKGSIKGFLENQGFGLKVPHMGWNSIDIQKKESKLFNNIPDGSHVYFVHSFYLDAENRADVAAVTEYGISFDSAVESGNIFGCQFHPEKSGEIGLNILKNFCMV